MKNAGGHQLAATFACAFIYSFFFVLLAIKESDVSFVFAPFLASRAEITLIAVLPRLPACLFRVSFGKRRIVSQVYNFSSASLLTYVLPLRCQL